MIKVFKLSILCLSTLFLFGCLEPDLPECDAKETRQLLSQIINQNLKNRGESESLVSLKNIDQVAFNKHTGIRLCKSNAIFSNANEIWMNYKIYWGKSQKGGLEKEFFVEIIDAGESY